MNTALQRKNMVDSQVRPSDVTDRSVIRAMLEVPRELFVPERARAFAYRDDAVELDGAAGGARALLAPRTFAKLLQVADITPTSTVLDIGAGSGYSSAVLSQLAAHVVALESDAALLEQAREALSANGAGKVVVAAGPLAAGWPDEGPYDVIVVEGAVEVMPSELLDQLKDGGRLVAIARKGASWRATVWQRSNGTYGTLDVFDAVAPVLPGFEKPKRFAF